MTSTLSSEGRRGRAPAAAVAARARGALRGTAVRLWHDNVADSAAALTYYGLLALLPALVVAVSLVGLLGDPTRKRLVAELTSYAPPQSAQVLQDALNGLSAAHTSVWTLAMGGVVSALWSACSYLAVFRRALHTMHRVPDTRPPLRAAHMLLITSCLLLLLLMAYAVGLVASGAAGPPARHGRRGGRGQPDRAALAGPARRRDPADPDPLPYRTGRRPAVPGAGCRAECWRRPCGSARRWSSPSTRS